MKNENPAMLVPPERFAENVKTIRARVAPPVSFQLLAESVGQAGKAPHAPTQFVATHQ